MKKLKISIKKSEVKIRKTWGNFNPSTRKQSNKKLYNRQKFKGGKYD